MPKKGRYRHSCCDHKIQEKQKFFIFSDSKYVNKLIEDLNSFRQDENLCDVVLLIEEKRFPAHRSILMAASEYFRAMFSLNMREHQLPEIPIVGLSSTAVLQILDYIYTGTLQVEKDEMQDLLVACDMLQITDIKNMCITCICDNITLSNCIDLYEFGETFDCSDLVDRVFYFMRSRFPLVARTEAFKRLSHTTVVKLLEHDELSLEPCGEMCVVGAVFTWLDHDPSRRQYITCLLDHIRWKSLPDACIAGIMEHPLVDKFTEMKDIICGNMNCEVTDTVEYSRHKQIVVVGGYLQSRTGPECPRLCSVEVISTLTKKTGLHALKWQILTSLPLDESPPSFVHVMVIDGQLIVLCLSYSTTAGRTTLDLQKLYRYNVMEEDWESLLEDQERTLHLTQTLWECVKNKGTVMSHDGAVFTISSKSVCKVQLESVVDDDSIKIGEVDSLGGIEGYTVDGTGCVQMMGAAVCSGVLYTIGGSMVSSETENYPITDVYKYVESENTWETMAEMTTPRSAFATTVLESKIYVSGGVMELRLCSVEMYDPQCNQWTIVRDMNKPRSYHMSVSANGRLYVIGGQTYPKNEGRKVLNTCAVYNPTNQKWTTLRHSMLHARCMASAVIW